MQEWERDVLCPQSSNINIEELLVRITKSEKGAWIEDSSLGGLAYTDDIV